MEPRKYPSGEEIQLHDKVRIGSSLVGVVVGVIDKGQYDASLAAEHWAHYRHGILVMTDEAGLIMYRGPQSDFEEFVKL